MIKRLSWLLSLAFLGVVLAAAPAAARGGHGGGHGGHGGWHGGGGHWHGGYRHWGGYRSWGGWGWGLGYYPYYRPYYWADPYPYYCGSRWIKVRRGGRLVWRRVLIRCY